MNRDAKIIFADNAVIGMGTEHVSYATIKCNALIRIAWRQCY